MCGITGIYHFDRQRSVDQRILRIMTSEVLHRGPDGEGYFIKDNLGLGHRRLSIIDLQSGDQPMYNQDQSIVVIFNGEIYNYIELKQELKSLGHQFTTNSDTEVIIRGYEQWGVECQEKLNGMWAFALWDDHKKRLFISRDRLGEKPLNYGIYDNTVLFGSEIKSILAYGLPKEANLELLEVYLGLGYIPAPDTFYKGIKKLKAGHYLLVQGENIKEYKYWDLPEINEAALIKDQSRVYNQFEELFTDSIKIRMRSDVPFGAFLSGGLDSGCVVATMSEVSQRPTETFTIGFKEKVFDERSLAKQVASKFQTNHHEYIVDPDQFDEALNNILRHYDEPFGDPAAMPTGYISKFAAAKVKMVLTGDGGDEVLSGYPTYVGEKFVNKFQQLPGALKFGLPKMVHGVSTLFRGDLRYRLNRAHRVLKQANYPFEQRLRAKLSSVWPYRIEGLTNGNHISLNDYLQELLKDCPFSDPFYKLMYFQLKCSLPDQMLLKVDKMSMAHSLETRIPFLDHRIVEFMYQVDKSIKLSGRSTKTVLKNTVAKKLPNDLLEAPKKGFDVPLREWFKDDAFEERLKQLYQKDLGLNQAMVKSIVQQNKEGKIDYGNFLWRLMVFSNWLN